MEKLTIICIAAALGIALVSCDDQPIDNTKKKSDEAKNSSYNFIESKEHPEGIDQMTIGDITFNLPAKYHRVQSRPDFFSFYATWTEQGKIITTVEGKNLSNVSHDNQILILVSGKIENGQSHEQWERRHREYLERRTSSEYTGLDALPTKNGKVMLYISNDKIFGLNADKPIVIFCGPVPRGLNTGSTTCYSTLKLDPKTYVEYRFSSRFMDNWHEIYQSIKSFLDNITNTNQ